MVKVIDRLVVNTGPNSQFCASRINIEQLTPATIPTDDDLLLYNEVSDDINKAVEVGQFRIPVGEFYFGIDNTDPNTILGYGTWSYLGKTSLTFV
jgi:hypothetical protein